VRNEYLSAAIGGVNYDYYIDWLSEDRWRYVAVSCERTYLDHSTGLGSTKLTFYIDNTLVGSTIISAIYLDDETYIPYIGEGFYGTIRKLRIYVGNFCLYSTSPTVSTSILPT